MGLSIHYKGSFKPTASLSAMIEEVKDIAEVRGWKNFVFETEFPADSLGKDNFNEHIYGIIFSPPGCEPVYLSFLSNGKLSRQMEPERYCNLPPGDLPEYFYMAFTKTQYAGMQTHMVIIQLLKYLSGKYFSDFELYDEGGYWETGDVNILAETFKRYGDLMDSFALALETIQPKKGDNIEKHFERIFKIIQRDQKKKKKKK